MEDESGKRGISLRELTPKQIVEKVRSGEISSCEYKTFAEYVKGMEKQ